MFQVRCGCKHALDRRCLTRYTQPVRAGEYVHICRSPVRTPAAESYFLRVELENIHRHRLSQLGFSFGSHLCVTASVEQGGESVPRYMPCLKTSQGSLLQSLVRVSSDE